jgi:hypothetical protein
MRSHTVSAALPPGADPYLAFLGPALEARLGELVEGAGELRIAGEQHIHADKPCRSRLAGERHIGAVGIDDAAASVGHDDRVADRIGQPVQELARARLQTKAQEAGESREKAEKAHASENADNQ